MKTASSDVAADAELAVFAVDDQVTFLKAAATVISATDGFRLIGCASSGDAALTRLDAIAGDVDVVLLDIELGDMSGVDVARQLANRHPDLAVVFLSMLDESDVLAGPDTAAVTAFIGKPKFGPDELHALTPALERRRARRTRRTRLG